MSKRKSSAKKKRKSAEKQTPQENPPSENLSNQNESPVEEDTVQQEEKKTEEKPSKEESAGEEKVKKKGKKKGGKAPKEEPHSDEKVKESAANVSSEGDAEEIKENVSEGDMVSVEKKEESAVEDEDEYAITILGWATAGYDTTKLEDALARRDMKSFKKDYVRFKKGVERIEEIKREVESLNIAGVEKDVNHLLTLLKDPLHVKKAENYLERVKKLIHAKDLEVELNSMMSIESLKPKADELLEDLKDPDNIDDVEEAMKDLRREFKEEYALNQFMELIDEKPREVKRIKVVEEVRKTSNPMMVKDLFVFTSTGKFMGHKTARKGAIDKKKLIGKLNEAREIIKNENISAGMSVKIPSEGEELLIVHKGAHVSAGLIISGKPHKLVGQLLKKGVEMMEHEDAEAIAAWSPKEKKPTLPHLKKNMNAIMYAALKLGKEMSK